MAIFLIAFGGPDSALPTSFLHLSPARTLLRKIEAAGSLALALLEHLLLYILLDSNIGICQPLTGFLFSEDRYKGPYYAPGLDLSPPGF